MDLFLNYFQIPSKTLERWKKRREDNVSDASPSPEKHEVDLGDGFHSEILTNYDKKSESIEKSASPEQDIGDLEQVSMSFVGDNEERHEFCVD